MRSGNLVITLTCLLAPSLLILSACTATVDPGMHNDIAYSQNAIPGQSVGVTSFPQPVEPVILNEPDVIENKSEPSPSVDTGSSAQQSKIETKRRKPRNELATVAPSITKAPEVSNAAVAQPSAQPTNWKPSQILLIRGNELIGGLQKEIGRKPNKEEMLKRLQSHMGLSSDQAQAVIASLEL